MTYGTNNFGLYLLPERGLGAPFSIRGFVSGSGFSFWHFLVWCVWAKPRTLVLGQYLPLGLWAQPTRLAWMGSLTNFITSMGMLGFLRKRTYLRKECPDWPKALRCFIAHGSMLSQVLLALPARALTPVSIRAFCLLLSSLPGLCQMPLTLSPMQRHAFRWLVWRSMRFGSQLGCSMACLGMLPISKPGIKQMPSSLNWSTGLVLKQLVLGLSVGTSILHRRNSNSCKGSMT